MQRPSMAHAATNNDPTEARSLATWRKWGWGKKKKERKKERKRKTQGLLKTAQAFVPTRWWMKGPVPFLTFFTLNNQINECKVGSQIDYYSSCLRSMAYHRRRGMAPPAFIGCNPSNTPPTGPPTVVSLVRRRLLS